MIDPRLAIFEKRLKPVRRVIAFGGGKGGIGKTTIAVLTAVAAVRSGRAVGYLDLDVHGGAAHLMLGIETGFPDEEGGILPFEGPFGLAFMSAVSFSADRPLALRGYEVTNAISELLAVTIWPELDVLIVDLPPGLGEGLLDLLKFMPRAEIVAVTTASAPAVAVARRFLAAVKPVAPVLGSVSNMVSGDAGVDLGLEEIARVPFDSSLEDSMGNPERLASLPSAAALTTLAGRICSPR